jgi:hypothetical protein
VTAQTAAPTIAAHPALIHSFLFEVCEMEGLETWETAGRVFVRSPHCHRPDDRRLVEITSTGDLDRLLDALRYCAWATCRELAGGSAS